MQIKTKPTILFKIKIENGAMKKIPVKNKERGPGEKSSVNFYGRCWFIVSASKEKKRNLQIVWIFGWKNKVKKYKIQNQIKQA